jgi:hypothetical protein
MMMLRLVGYATWCIQTRTVYILIIYIRSIRLRNLEKKHNEEMKVIEDTNSKKYNQCCQVPSIYTYLLTPWCTVLLEKLTGLQLVQKFPEFYGTRRFNTMFTSAAKCI